MEQFADRVRAALPTWRAIDTRSICFHQGDDWRSILASIRLLPGRPDEYEPMELEYEGNHFAVLQEIADFSKLGELVEGLLHDRLRVRSRDARLDCPEPPTNQPRPYYYSMRLVERVWARQYHFVMSDFQTLVLQGSGQQIGSFVSQEELDRASVALTAHQKPFNGLDDVVQSLFYSGAEFARGSIATVTVSAPAYSHIEKIEEVRGRTYDITVMGPPSARPDEFRLNVIMRPASGPSIRRSMRFAKRDVASHGGYLRMKKRVQVVDAPFVEAFLVRGGEPVDLSSFYLPTSSTANPRLNAQLTFDPDGKKLTELLFPTGERPRADTFEIGISWLLFLCGFQTVSHGLHAGKLNDEVDCLAFVPLSRNVLAIECTTADLNPTKLVKFANRCSLLREALPDFEVLPMAATSVGQVTTTESKTAAELGIAVLTRPEIEEVLRRAGDNAAPSEIYQFFRTKVVGSFDRDPRSPVF